MKVRYMIPEIEAEFVSIGSFFATHPDALVMEVDGVEVIGTCDHCRQLILLGQQAIYGDDSIVHAEHFPDEFEQLKTGVKTWASVGYKKQ